MYVSYFWLFAVLFINKYFGPKVRRNPTGW
jgi:hypothetical protein